MVNVDKLKGKIVENRMSVDELAKKLEIHTSTLYRKLSKNGDELTIREIDIIANELNLSLKEINEIFFSQYVANVR